jgi:hypothetical protein
MDRLDPLGVEARCHMIPISFVPHDPDRSDVCWLINRRLLRRSS